MKLPKMHCMFRPYMKCCVVKKCKEKLQFLVVSPPLNVKSQIRPNTPLARNQYINNSLGFFSCIRAGANTGATCIRTEMKSLKSLPNMWKMSPQKYFPVFARVRIQAPHAFAQKLVPQDFFLACIGFVPGANWPEQDHLWKNIH